jgi:hypothetical protein
VLCACATARAAEPGALRVSRDRLVSASPWGVSSLRSVGRDTVDLGLSTVQPSALANDWRFTASQAHVPAA